MNLTEYQFWDGGEWVHICIEADSVITEFFRVSELACKTSGIAKFHPGFLTHLSLLRITADHSMTPTNCCRSQEEWERLKAAGYNPHPKSLHLIENGYHPTEGCMAVDISTNGWSAHKRSAFMDLARELGWSLGIADTFLHLDRRVDIGLARAEYNY